MKRSNVLITLLLMVLASCDKVPTLNQVGCIPGIPMHTTRSAGGFITMILMDDGGIMQFFVGRGADVHLNRLPVDRIGHQKGWSRDHVCP